MLFCLTKMHLNGVRPLPVLGMPPKKIDQRSAESNSQGFQGSALRKASQLSRKEKKLRPWWFQLVYTLTQGDVPVGDNQTKVRKYHKSNWRNHLRRKNQRATSDMSFSAGFLSLSFNGSGEQTTWNLPWAREGHIIRTRTLRIKIAINQLCPYFRELGSEKFNAGNCEKSALWLLLGHLEICNVSRINLVTSRSNSARQCTLKVQQHQHDCSSKQDLQ